MRHILLLIITLGLTQPLTAMEKSFGKPEMKLAQLLPLFVGAIAAMAIPQHGRFAFAGAGPAPTRNLCIAHVLRDLQEVCCTKLQMRPA